MRCVFFILLLITCGGAKAQPPVDVLHYRFELELSDQSDVIAGKAYIRVKFLSPSQEVAFDLVGLTGEKGMKVFQVKEEGKAVNFFHNNDKLVIRLKSRAGESVVRSFEIDYMGVPADGLIISSNKYNERTFFADNWPDRARHWIPCVDHPNDKSSVEFIVKAPGRYRVVSNGLLQEEIMEEGNIKRTHWKEDIPIPTKIMVIGVAAFAVERVDSAFSVPVTAWVYPQDSAAGVKDFALADDMLRYFEDLIGPYPFRKLANVQSKTIFGGMENANAIFYAENAVTGTGSIEALVAHEVVHQWFGNTVTEKNFHHLWLSEGFATYLASMYIGEKFGKDSFENRMAIDRAQVIRFLADNPLPVVDSVSDYMSLLNANSYQKGGWILHMLREEVGETNFRDILRSFYEQYKFLNAGSKDFQTVVERVSRRDMQWFFEQWLYRPGIPELKIEMKTDHNGFHMRITQQGELYKIPLHIEIIKPDGEVIRERIWIDQKETNYNLKLNGAVQVAIDQNKKLLYKSVD